MFVRGRTRNVRCAGLRASAVLRKHNGETSITNTGEVTVPGTYMAPEQIAACPWDLGRILRVCLIAFEMLTGTHPFR